MGAAAYWKLRIERHDPLLPPQPPIKKIVVDNGLGGNVRYLSLRKGGTNYFFYYERTAAPVDHRSTRNTIGGDLGITRENLIEFAYAILELTKES